MGAALKLVAEGAEVWALSVTRRRKCRQSESPGLAGEQEAGSREIVVFCPNENIFKSKRE